MAHSDDATTARQRRDSGEVLPLTESEGPDLCGSYVADTSRELQHRGRGAWHGRLESPDCGFDAADPDGHGCARTYIHLRSRGSHETAFHARRSCPTVSNANGERLQERNLTSGGRETGLDSWSADPRGDLWLSEPDVGRVADGVSSRVDRLKCLGNAVVPQQAFPIFQAIAAIEMGAIV